MSDIEQPKMPEVVTSEPREFVEVYSEHFSTIVRYLRRRLGDCAGEDAAAEVFLRAFRSGVRPAAAGRSPLPWLYGIATNVILEERRAERQRWRTLDRLAHQATSEGTDPAEAASDLDPRLTRALRRLNPVDRETLLLVAWGELTGEEVAQVLDVPAGTVRSRLSRGRRQLSGVLGNPDAVTDFRPTIGDHHA